MLDAEYIKVLVKKSAEFGNGKIHIIVNNAGSVSLDAPQTHADISQIYVGRSNSQGKNTLYTFQLRHLADWLI